MTTAVPKRNMYSIQSALIKQELMQPFVTMQVHTEAVKGNIKITSPKTASTLATFAENGRKKWVAMTTAVPKRNMYSIQSALIKQELMQPFVTMQVHTEAVKGNIVITSPKTASTHATFAENGRMKMVAKTTAVQTA